MTPVKLPSAFDPPTQKQLDLLIKLGVDIPDDLTKVGASRMIDAELGDREPKFKRIPSDTPSSYDWESAYDWPDSTDW